MSPDNSSPAEAPPPDGARIIVLATTNSHKVEEITAIVRRIDPEARIRFVAAGEFEDIEEPEETGSTFEQNALLKARYWAEKTGHLAVADDSGLAIDALDGRPGIFSARYEATAARRNAKVLSELEGVPAEARSARFICVAAIADRWGSAQCVEGRIEGWITDVPRGEGGFGYDPIFEPREVKGRSGRTLAEYSSEEKNRISHRGRAFAGLTPLIVEAAVTGRVSRARSS